MTADDLLRELARAGAMPMADGDRLRITWPDPPPAERVELLARIKTHKAAVLDLLRLELTEERYQERAAICEYDGGLTRKDAETRALLDATLALGEWLLKKRPDLPADLPARLAAVVERELGSCR